MKKKPARAVPLTAPPVTTPAEWTFLTNHAHVLWCIYRAPETRLRDIALQVGITERMVHKIVSELAADGFLTIEKQGRRNVYHLQVNRPLRHPLEAHCQVGQLLALLKKSSS